MINVSDTHLSVANIQDLAHPRLDSIIEVAPRGQRDPPLRGPHRRAGGPGPGALVTAGGGRVPGEEGGRRAEREGARVATFQVGQATAVYRVQDKLVILRRVESRPRGRYRQHHRGGHLRPWRSGPPAAARPAGGAVRVVQLLRLLRAGWGWATGSAKVSGRLPPARGLAQVRYVTAPATAVTARAGSSLSWTCATRPTRRSARPTSRPTPGAASAWWPIPLPTASTSRTARRSARCGTSGERLHPLPPLRPALAARSGRAAFRG